MSFKLASSCPAKAVDTSDNSKRVDSDGGGTAGTSPVGMGAAGANGSHPCEIPPQLQSPGAIAEPTTSQCSRTSQTTSSRAAWSPGMSGNLGNMPPSPRGVVAHCTTDPINESPPSAPVHTPDIHLKKHAIRLGTWNMRGCNGPSNLSKLDTTKMLMKLEKVDLMVLTETHSNYDSPPAVRGMSVLSHTGISSTRAGVAICAIDNGQWSCKSSVILVPGHALLCELYNTVSTETLYLLGVYANISDYPA